MTVQEETALAAAVAAFKEQASRWPSAAAPSAQERNLGVWLATQRRSAAIGSLDVFRQEFLDTHMVGWNTDPDERWASSARDLSDFLISTGRTPVLGSELAWERGIAAWLRMQQSLLVQGSLRPARCGWLDSHCPGWRPGIIGSAPAGTPAGSAAHMGS